MDLQSNREISILSFWHKLEFFAPFDAKQKITEAQDDDRYYSFSIDELKSLPPDQSIRHLIPNAPPDKQFGGASLYLNLFDTNKISQIIQDILQEALSEHEQFSQEAMGAGDGITCFARLDILTDGTLNIRNIQLSTVPWALGLSAQDGLTALNMDRFEQDCSILKDELLQINQKYHECRLSPTVLLRLIDVLNQWAYDLPLVETNTPVIGICLKWQNKTNKEFLKDDLKNKQDKANDNRDGNSDDANQEDDTGLVADDIGILNSFYAKDIHSIIRKIKQEKASSPTLSAYLSIKPDQAKIDLYSDEGNRLIWQNLQPKYWNHGRWASEPAHGLSLMQQFAVNTFFKESGQLVFSVNGPPGTGKTTLLRDIFAENIVRRARELVKLTTATDAFDKKLDGGIWTLKPELTGYEMVVASSNNAAVENISRDLPKKESLAKIYQTKEQNGFNYLETVARNLVAKQGNKYKKLSENQEIWGLFSCTLGKKANQNKVKEGLFFVNQEGDGYDPNLHQTIWQWRNDYKGITFEQAKKDFNNQQELVQQRLDKLQYLFELHEQVVLNNHSNQLKQQCHKLNKQLETAKRNLEQAKTNLRQAQNMDPSTISVDRAFAQALTQAKTKEQAAKVVIDTCQDQKSYWQHKLQALEHGKPGFFTRLFQSQKYKEYKKNLIECHEQLAQIQINESQNKQVLQQCLYQLGSASDSLLLEQKRIHQQRVETAKSCVQQHEQQRDEYQEKTSQVLEKLKNLNDAQEKYKNLLAKFPKIKLPTSLNELHQDDFQISGLWRDDDLNYHRSCLFGKALQLHEAWLAEVSKPNCGFGGNISKLSQFLQGNIALNHEQTLAIWQSLFMIAPVVSSTFASFARQFQGMGSGSLGYLFIDEAGQAVPQAAAGAIWRANRVMVVGDPIQIEPVFTTPPTLVRHLETISDIPKDTTVSPLAVSVQILADKCNRFGANVGQNGELVWIGSPLRVHRRCFEPMFGIANKIAYEGKMILAETNLTKQWPNKEGLYLGESSWVQVVGQARPSQFVQAQADVVIQMLTKIIQHTGKLPDLYIISPFKKIKNELIDQIMADCALKATKGLANWCQTHIGTVHTFQGKEENIVWFVLGCDEDTDGAAQWAASKPNLLNVALTRAKRYVFIFGDKKVWVSKPYFDYATQTLPEISSECFLSQGDALIEDLDK
ncbi:AAA domain-containing protein [Moraxella marmotae]|uniref:AAA domain-containing protein n=1 Tax=Moraxella marmotae TaxID=3344520 RepID=UPI0035F2C5C0